MKEDELIKERLIVPEFEIWFVDCEYSIFLDTCFEILSIYHSQARLIKACVSNF